MQEPNFDDDPIEPPNPQSEALEWADYYERDRDPEESPEAIAADAEQVEADDRARALPVSLDFDGDQLASMLDELAADHTRRNLTEAAIRDKAIAIVNTRAAARTAAREQRLAGGEVTSELDIRAEAVGAADDADVLRAFSRAFGDAAKQGDVLTAELVGLLPERNNKPRRSFTVADGHGFDLKATSSPRTEAFADMPEIVDVIVATLVTHREKMPEQADANDLRNFGEGVRSGIFSILEVLTSPKVKTTALDSLGKQLQGMNRVDLAQRLSHAYGRKEVGEPTVKVERTPSKVAK